MTDFPKVLIIECLSIRERVLTYQDLAVSLSQESRKIAVCRNEPSKVVKQQLQIYRHILSECDEDRL